MNTDAWSDKDYMRINICEQLNYRYDTEPDEFSFNFLGYSGKFYLDHKGKWQVQCDQPIKVQLIPDPANPNISQALPPPAEFNPPACAIQSWKAAGGFIRSFAGFIITTEDGTQYTFGGETNAIEYSMGFFT